MGAGRLGSWHVESDAQAVLERWLDGAEKEPPEAVRIIPGLRASRRNTDEKGFHE